MDKQSDIEKELEELGAKFLKDNFDRIDSFGPSKNFLEGFEDKMMAKIHEKQGSELKIRKLRLLNWYSKVSILSSAAIVLLMLAMIYYVQEYSATECTALACLDRDLIYDYIEDDIDAYTVDLLEEVKLENRELSLEETLILEEIDDYSLIEEL